jgi:hypothetical protein
MCLSAEAKVNDAPRAATTHAATLSTVRYTIVGWQIRLE